MLDVVRAPDLVGQPESERWLVEGLWADQAVGIVGGEPKLGKSFLALDMAVAVASGTPCLGEFPTMRQGRVLLFAAEDALHIVRARLEGIARAAGTEFGSLDVHVITNPTVRLDLEADREKLQETVRRMRPVLLVLDPFVRLHRIDENASQHVAPLLAYLRQLQRRYATAVVLVHHARKGGHVRPGQALRGSSELHAWGDTNLYLRRARDQLSLTVEHRAAKGQDDILLELGERRGGLALGLATGAPALKRPRNAEQRVEQALAEAAGPLTRRDLRGACRMRTSNMLQAIAKLTEEGRLVEGEEGFSLAASD